MNNLTLALLYGALACISLTLLFLSLRLGTGRLHGSFRFAAAMLLCWQLILVLYFSCNNPAICLYLYDLNLPFVALATLAWFLYFIRFYGLSSYFPITVRLCLYVIPSITSVLVLLSPFHSFIRANVVFASFTPLHIVTSTRMPWFWFHAAYCYFLMVAALFVALIQHSKINVHYRRTSAMLLLGLCLTMLGNLAVLAALVPFDISLVFATLALVIFFAANRNEQGMEFFQQARQEVFHYINRGVLILDDQDRVVSLNRAAENLLAALDISAESIRFEQVTGRLAALAKHISTLEDVQGTDYHLHTGEVYNLQRNSILDNDNKAIGTFAVLSDARENRAAIARLDAAAGMDALTGLSNRRKHEATLAQLDHPSNLPLAVIAGDLNNLKTTNDLYGHPQGDIYIRLAAQLLKELCSPNAHIARTGGDEFMILLPHCDQNQARQLTNSIREAFGNASGYVFQPSIALGFAVKEAPEQDIAEIQSRADTAMYEDKERAKHKARR